MIHTMKTTHTPEPWNLHLDRYPNGKLSGRPYIYAPNGPDTHRHVCEVYIDDGASPEIQAMQEANGYLLAAAPELLDAVERVLIAFEDGGGMNDIDWDKLRAAIAKATP